MNSKILIVDDDRAMLDVMGQALGPYYEVLSAASGSEALRLLRSFCASGAALPDLILLDIMLPELNGLEVLRRLHNEKQTPVILLTARDSVMDKVSGLDAGAVDYITKPFAIEELLARIRVALKFRHAQTAAEESAAADAASRSGTLSWGSLVLEEKGRKVTYGGQEIVLTNREFLMLRILLENRDIVLSRDTLLDRVCGYDYIGETNIVDVYIRHLRTKIDEAFGVRMIQTVRGAGYVIRGE